METIPTSQGKKLLAGGCWGFVRHPNYLGDIICYIGVIPFVAKTPLVLMPVLGISYMVYRVKRNQQRSKRRYGPAFDRYCQKVKYALIPKVF